MKEGNGIMEKINDGGPAFPQMIAGNDEPGMSLRDWFAGQALAGFLANPETMKALDRASAIGCAPLAKLAYEAADAMLDKRA